MQQNLQEPTPIVKEEPFDWSLEQVVAHHLAEPDLAPSKNQSAQAPHSAHYHKDKTKVILKHNYIVYCY
jgi:hypothetical protein